MGWISICIDLKLNLFALFLASNKEIIDLLMKYGCCMWF